jgi:hypothetical protein
MGMALLQFPIHVYMFGHTTHHQQQVVVFMVVMHPKQLHLHDMYNPHVYRHYQYNR